MSGGPGSDLHQRALAEAVRDVLARLSTRDGRAPAAVPGEGRSALDTLCACFGLTPFERDILVLAAAVEIEPSAADTCARACGDPIRRYPTFGLALAALTEPHWSALAPVAPLRRFRLVEVEPDTPITSALLRIDERVLHFLAGVPYLDTRLHGMLVPLDQPPALAPSHQAVADQLSTRWNGTGAPHAVLCGADPQTRAEIAAAAAAAAGLRACLVREIHLPNDAVEREVLCRLWEREALLLPAALVVECDAAGTDRHAVAALAGTLRTPLAVSASDPPAGFATAVRLAVPELTQSEQHALWCSTLDGSVPRDDPGVADGLGRLVAQFSLPAHVIRAAGDRARHLVEAGADGTDVARLAWRAGLDEARVGLDELGRRIEPRARWEDLVLPEPQRRILEQVVAHVRQRGTVYQDWGFASLLRRGLGVTALFAGGSGTGKTLAAEVIAAELGLDLFVIDLSQVVNKYIGETEKNLRRVFDAAERGGAVLLFDEADALFGKRSEVKDSHDRYANIEVSYLLMRMEEYRGLAVLTTNMRKALDTAFLRRLRFVVEFPFPGAGERAEIWRRVIPARVPTDGLDPERLAQLTVAGGSIRNIALSAAFLAAEEGVPLSMRHLLSAARTEYAKLERALGPAEVAGWQ